MSIRTDYELGWFLSKAPTNVTVVSSTSGTFQAPVAGYKSLYCITSPSALFLLLGTGASVSVTVTTGLYWPANVPFMFFPEEGSESVGWLTSDSSGNAGASAKVTVACVSKRS